MRFTKEELLEELNKGGSQMEVAERLYIHTSSLQKLIKDNGIKLHVIKEYK